MLRSAVSGNRSSGWESTSTASRAMRTEHPERRGQDFGRKSMATALPDVRRLAEQLDAAGAFSHRVGWLEGRADPSREKLWEARAGFLAAGDDLWAARTLLDLLRHLSPDGPPPRRAV